MTWTIPEVNMLWQCQSGLIENTLINRLFHCADWTRHHVCSMVWGSTCVFRKGKVAAYCLQNLTGDKVDVYVQGGLGSCENEYRREVG